MKYEVWTRKVKVATFLHLKEAIECAQEHKEADVRKVA